MKMYKNFRWKYYLRNNFWFENNHGCLLCTINHVHNTTAHLALSLPVCDLSVLISLVSTVLLPISSKFTGVLSTLQLFHIECEFCCLLQMINLWKLVTLWSRSHGRSVQFFVSLLHQLTVVLNFFTKFRIVSCLF